MVLALSTLLAAAAPASALDVEVKGLHTAGAAVTTAIELRDVIPERFRKTLVEGGVLHLRVQAELWEARPVWDRLVYPAIVRVFRFTPGAYANGVASGSYIRLVLAVITTVELDDPIFHGRPGQGRLHRRRFVHLTL